MAKAITAPEITAEALLETAISSLVTSYSGTKTAGDYGVMTRAKAEKIIIQRALAKNRRGRTGGA
jgi:hypothetical protein